jgi:hypothetical protein
MEVNLEEREILRQRVYEMLEGKSTLDLSETEYLPAHVDAHTDVHQDG